MKRILSLLFLISLCVLSLADTTSEDSSVLVGTNDNFDDILSENEFVLVEFYAPWCGHCKNLAPEYEKAATLLEEEDSPIKLVKVDATAETDLASKYEIRGYPTLIFFSNGDQMPYDGDRTAAGLVRWVKKKSGPPSVVVEDADAFVESINGPVVLGVFKDEESKAYRTFLRVAKTEDDFNFGHQFSADDDEKITVFVDGEEKTFDGSTITKQAIKEWLLSEGYPALVELDQKVWQRSSSAKRHLFTGFVDVNDEEIMNTLREVAANYKEKLVVSYMDSNRNGALAERWGASGKVFPTATIVIQGEEPYIFVWNEDEEESYDAKALGNFIEKSLDGTYKAYVKSEPIPEENDGPVTVVVGKQFEEIVFDETKNVLVEFYAPWCGHCKKLAPIYEELGEKFADNENVVIAKMDATANTPPAGIPITGYPTLLFFAADDKNPEPYEGARTLESLVEFIEKRVGTPAGEEHDL